jgi:exopolyphosphatase/guanosine-5'-triphosphate,3'-diphosphate pyrophosphatase
VAVHPTARRRIANGIRGGTQPKARSSARIAAIDVGSNAIRLVIGEQDEHGDIRIIRKVREPVRLGKDAFANGWISEKSLQKTTQAFRKFAGLLEEQRVSYARAVATSALREASNRDLVIREVRDAAFINIEVIDGVEEGRLIFSAVTNRLDLQERISLLVDIGGGSVELTIADHGKLLGTQSFKLGTVRLLRLLEEKKLQEKQLPPLIQERLEPVKSFLRNTLKGLHVDHVIGTGGNFECLGKLRVALLQKSSIFSMTHHELRQMITHLTSMSVKERIHFLRLRPDRADVLIPAALVADAIMTIAEVDLLTIPYVGLRDGILTDLSQKIGLRAVR